MDIHKPKAAHSIREFLIEIGTITTGILIALSLEAGIEAWHNHRTVEHARADLRRELADNRMVLGTAMANQKSVLAKIDIILAHVRDRRAHRPGAALPQNLRLDNTFSMMSTAAWESTVATQALTHMPYDEAQALARAYAGAHGFNSFEAETVKPWFELASLTDDFDAMTPEQLLEAQRLLGINRSYQDALITSEASLMKGFDRALAKLG